MLSLAPRMPQKGDLDILSNYFKDLMYVYLSPTGQTIAELDFIYVLRMGFHSRRHVEHGRAFNCWFIDLAILCIIEHLSFRFKRHTTS